MQEKVLSSDREKLLKQNPLKSRGLLYGNKTGKRKEKKTRKDRSKKEGNAEVPCPRTKKRQASVTGKKIMKKSKKDASVRERDLSPHRLGKSTLKRSKEGSRGKRNAEPRKRGVRATRTTITR